MLSKIFIKRNKFNKALIEDKLISDEFKDYLMNLLIKLKK